MLLRGTYLCVIFFILCSKNIAYGQKDSLRGSDLINHYLVNNQIEKASKELEQQLERLWKNRQYDSLCYYPYLVGKVRLEKTSAQQAVRTTEAFVQKIENSVPGSSSLHIAYTQLADLYDELAFHREAFKTGKKALDHILKVPGIPLEDVGDIEYNIGISAYNLDSLVEANYYFKKAIDYYERSATTKKEKLADGYNALGAVAWTFNKLDSAQHYYKKAVTSVEASDADNTMKLYLSLFYRTNIALLQESQGQVFEAIETQKSILSDCKIVIDKMKDPMYLERAKRTESLVLGNLGAMYHDLGYISRSNDILRMAYRKKLVLYEPSDQRLTNNLIQIAQSEIALNEFDDALITLDSALNTLHSSHEKYLSKKAEILTVIGKVHSITGNIEQALAYYNESNALYQKVYIKNFSREYLIFLREYALFLAENDQPERALDIGMKGYDYARKNAGADSFLLFNHTLNLAKINHLSGNFKATRSWAEIGNNHLDQKITESRTKLDSIKIEFNKPQTILLEVRALYELAEDKVPSLLKALIGKLERAVLILERRKSTIFTNDDVSLLLSEYKNINDFLKKLFFELYEQTHDEQYLNRLISLNESAIYTRIRAKLGILNQSYSNVSKETLARENELKKKISNALLTPTNDDLKDFFDYNAQWGKFLDSLRTNYPKYYGLHYASIENTLTSLRNHIPDNTTVIRYFFIEDSLYALIFNSESRKLIAIGENNLSELIEGAVNSLAPKKAIKNLNRLYEILWAPLSKLVSTPKVIIIPDRELFNLSFEMLTPEKITTFEELAYNCLLSKYQISYNYSLVLLNNGSKLFSHYNNYVAFTPVFTKKMKESYTLTISDSLDIDKSYLALSSLPFSGDLAKNYSKKFDGSSFLNENASKQVFANLAREHRIIHIGTHAESNNLSPEFSRLIFAKNLNDEATLNDNSVYTYEIYNYNLASNLTVLTACETGKPSYQPGEGMISLAHAFNYAGSESILTSLWNIDEQSSTQIVGYLYENLLKGMTKDEALQKAKLNYLKNARGRALAPQYWAGLVLIGNTSAIPLSKSNVCVFKVVGLVVFLLLISLIIFKIFRRSRK
ncbi:CHAT domain-containing tetratricopeptide repeat protein [Seonamhaeicola sp.]|uniref:CHAT domain-containing protein n=1 Tax=Seonamhaeicola sp. TaxID=1912245 RepID=UPI00261F24DE|nr:CHAT domain-containing tetratricopeptide repeat protein [Seonamhaeicola sp.]